MIKVVNIENKISSRVIFVMKSTNKLSVFKLYGNVVNHEQILKK